MRRGAIWQLLILWADGEVEELACAHDLPHLLRTTFRTAEMLSDAAAPRAATEIHVGRNQEIVLTIKVERGVPLAGFSRT